MRVAYWVRQSIAALRMEKMLATLSLEAGEVVGSDMLRRAKARAKVTPFSLEDCLISEIDIYRRTLRGDS